MDRKRLTQRFPFLLPMRRAQRKMCFYAGMRFDGCRYAQTIGETFSFWWLVRHADKDTPYKDGL
ncbi:TPA: hypothetical protein ACIZFH_003299, partial [Enterococcus faecium]